MGDLDWILQQLDIQSDLVGNSECTQAKAAREIRRQRDRIEELERELAGARQLVFASGVELGKAEAQLAAEKELADRLYLATFVKDSRAARESYRKARGL